MKVQLIVVRGKPEGKVIPLAGSKFKIGRGETCHLRPNSEQVSREHAEFAVGPDSVTVRDLGSRNGTLVNGKAVTTESYKLKDRDLVQVGPLTFAVSIQDAPVSQAKAPATPVARKPKSASLDDVSGDEIDSWLIGDNAGASSDQPTAVYGGDTITITAFKDAAATPPAATTPPPAITPPAGATPPTSAKPPASASDDEYERMSGEDEENEQEEADEEPLEEAEEEEEEEEAAEPVEEFMDESNPFYVAKKAQKEQASKPSESSHKPQFKDTSDAASDILRKLMERRRASKS